MNIPQLEVFKIQGLTQKQSNAIYYFASILLGLAVISYLLGFVLIAAGAIVVLKIYGESQIKQWRTQNKELKKSQEAIYYE